DPNQLRLFDDAAEQPTESQPAEAVPEDPETPARTWMRRGRRALPEHLPRERIVLELSEQERVCPGCGRPRMPFGEEVSEQLEYVPAALFVRQFMRRKYACVNLKVEDVAKVFKEDLSKRLTDFLEIASY